MRRLIPLILATACGHPRPISPTVPELASKIDAIAARTMEDLRIAGATVLVAQEGTTILVRGYGQADRERTIAASADTVYRIGSITKQFTAAAILQLAEQNKLSLDDELQKYLPDFPRQGHRVTLRHLLTHTSGIKSYTDLPEGELERLMDIDMTHEQVVARFKDLPFDFEPGTKWRYDNSGYFLLGMIVEQASGQSYIDYLRAHVFPAAGLEHTIYCPHDPTGPEQAQGYSHDKQPFGVAAPLSMTLPYAAGALCSTAGDLWRWTVALASGKVVSPASYAQMTTGAKLTDGSDSHYGFGLFIGRLDGHRRITHGGGINGFNADLTLYPDDQTIVVVLTNNEGGAQQLAGRVARAVLGIPLGDLPVGAAQLAALPGEYRFSEGPPVRIEAKDGHLLFYRRSPEPAPMLHQGNGVFTIERQADLKISFTVENGKATTIRLERDSGVSVGTRAPGP